MFRAGTTKVTCVASDAAGHRRTRRFDVILIDETVPLLAGYLPDEQITVTANNMNPTLPVSATICSEPVDVGEFMPDADGTAT